MILAAFFRRFLPVAFLLTGGVRGFGCAACLGNSDSAMANAMNWGVMTLLVVVVGVLSGIAAFFVYIARRSAMLAKETSLDEMHQTARKFA